MRKFKIKSRSKVGISYEVQVDDEGKIYCECPAGSRKIDCNHKILIKDFLARKPVPYRELCRIAEI